MMENYIILLAILGLGIFFLLKKRQEKMSKSATGGQQASKILPKISIKGIIIILLILTIISWDFFHTNTYTFGPNVNINNYLRIDSGNQYLSIDPVCGCLVITGLAKFTIKGSENLHVSKVVLIPNDDSAEMTDVHIITGGLDSSYYIGPSPDGAVGQN
jgi:hypothetical protein